MDVWLISIFQQGGHNKQGHHHSTGNLRKSTEGDVTTPKHISNVTELLLGGQK
jgi:hypothetical protein